MNNKIFMKRALNDMYHRKKTKQKTLLEKKNTQRYFVCLFMAFLFFIERPSVISSHSNDLDKYLTIFTPCSTFTPLSQANRSCTYN